MGTQPQRGSAPKPPPRLSELLLRDGAPWRPFAEEGVLCAASKSVRNRQQIYAACERELLAHLKAVCSWPEALRNKGWRIGDYSFYVIDFSPAPGMQVYVQFWSDPDSDDVTFEVSSGAWNPPADKYVDADRQELLRDHGFEVGGSARNFGKSVRAANTKQIKSIAREAIAVLCDALGYDGRQDLHYQLHLGTSASQAYVFDSLAADQLVSLCKEWGYVAKLKPRQEGQLPLLECRGDGGSFGMLLADPDPTDTNAFKAIALRTYLKLPGSDADAEDNVLRLQAVNAITQSFSALQASLDEDGDLQLETAIFLHGGVTAEHIRMRLQAWRGSIAKAREGLITPPSEP